MYHFNVIYNHARSKYSATPDTELSLRFVEFLVGKLNGWGYNQFYYYDEHALPGRNVFEELFRVVNGSEWSFVILTKEFSSNCWVKYCQMAAFKNLIDKTKRDKLIPITVGDVKLPVELEVNDVLSFDDDQTTWNQNHTKQLNRLQRVLDEKISVAATAEVVPVQEHGDGRVRSERDHIITQTQPSVEESLSSCNPNSHIEVDGFDNIDGTTHHPDADDGIGEMEQNAAINPARTSNHYYPQSIPSYSPTTDTPTNIQGEQRQTGTVVKPSVTQSNRDQWENTHDRALPASTSTITSNSILKYEQANVCTPSELEQPHNLPISSVSRPVVTMSTNASLNSERVSPEDSASQLRTTLCQLGQTEYKANTQSSSEPSIQVSSLTTEYGLAMVESGPTIKIQQIDNSHRSGTPLKFPEGQSSLQSDVDVMIRQDSVDGLIEEEIVSRQCGGTMTAACSPRPELSHDKTEQNKDVNRLPYEGVYPEQRMKELKFDHEGQHVDYLSLSEDQDITLDQERSNLQQVNIRLTSRSKITNEHMRPEELLNDFNQRLFEMEGSTLHIDSLMNTGNDEPGELTAPKHITSSSDAGYISADNISNNSISSSHHGRNNCEVHTNNSDGMDVKPNSSASDSKQHLRNSKYSGDVQSGNNQMDVVDPMNKERLFSFSARGKESNPEQVIGNKNKDEEVPVRGEMPRPVGSEAVPDLPTLTDLRKKREKLLKYVEVKSR
ncbi:hypothetical protein CHS0354_010451 [Potamilus streckersoni]|uniref:TIR domain-containing protein n=1 Tax=Potamilus streckersoni TaxID=2493646 RepID=A0AAE0SQZ4_9BIVA|nr:hypothetical protein CHS0354_010451 [Potamilus streckersoni]